MRRPGPARRMARPEGRTERERWPDDAALEDAFARSVAPWALGAVEWVAAAPLWLADLVVAAPWTLVVLVAVAGATTPFARRPGRAGRWAGRVWRVAVWALLVMAAMAAIVALLVRILPGCGSLPDCGLLQPNGAPRGPGVVLGVVLVVAVAAVSIGSALAAVRLGRSLAHPPRAAAPALDAWWARRGRRSRADRRRPG